jgi:hypothetical protein
LPHVDLTSALALDELAFECFGVRIGVSTNDDRVRSRLPDLIPPHSSACDAGTVAHHFSVNSDDGSTFNVRYDVRDGVPARPLDAASYVASDVDIRLALGLLDTHLHSCVAFRAVDRFFISAGAVGYLDRMIVLPGPALSGKSTLVAALLRAGATYYSDEFAVLDEEGQVHPYSTPLRLQGADHAIGSGGPNAGKEPLPVGAVVLTSYRPGAEWGPRKLSRGESLVALISQTVPAQERPEDSMRVLRRMLDADPVVIQGDRDEAEEVAGLLLAELERQAP